MPSIATMLLGVMAGCWLRGTGSASQKVRGLVIAGVLLLAAGIALDPAILPGVDSMRWTICPIIKRLWTPSYVLYSGGWVMLDSGDALLDRRHSRHSPVDVSVCRCRNEFDCHVSCWRRWLRIGFADCFIMAVGRSAFDSTYGPIFESLAVLAIFLAHLPVGSIAYAFSCECSRSLAK